MKCNTCSREMKLVSVVPGYARFYQCKNCSVQVKKNEVGDQEDQKESVEKTLSEKLKSAGRESHRKWFDRWFLKNNVEKRMMESASKGYQSSTIRVDNQEEYLKNRLSDKRTIEKLKERLGQGIDITFKEEHSKNLLGWPVYKSYILIKW